MMQRARHSAIRVAAACLMVWLASAPTGFAGKQPREKESGKRRWSFTKTKVGERPKGWRIAETAGVKTPATWMVVADPTAPTPPNALAITENKNPNKTFNLLIARRTEYKDLEISVMVKAIAGKMDQGGGPIWRCKDPNNYYVARWNPLEDNIRVYFVKNGKRKQLGTADVKVDVKKWHKVGVKHAGDEIEVYLNDKKMIEVEDSTFSDPGMIGLWVKADGRSAFDDLTIIPQGTFRGKASRDARGENKSGRTSVTGSLVWESNYTATGPRVDGQVDPVWETAKPLTVTVREAFGGSEPRPVLLRSLHTEETFYVLARWPDAARNDMRDPYVWDSEKGIYHRPSQPDDQFALEFPLQGDFSVNMISLDREYIADVWHWKAGRGNPVGWVDDKRHIISRRAVAGSQEYSMGDKGKVYIARLMDEGQPSYVSKPKPEAYAGAVVDSFEPRQPTGSLADVRGKGVHDGGHWTLEMSRKFNTGHPDDCLLDPSRSSRCAIAVLDDELYWHHSVSEEITLQFSR